MHLSWIKKNLNANTKQFKAGDIYYTQAKNVASTLENLKARGVDKAIDIISINSAFKAFTFGDKQTILIVRSGGIGDLLALSSLRYVLKNNMHFITLEQFIPVFDWWESPPEKIMHVTKPLYSNVNFSELIRMQYSIRRFVSEGLIENGSGKNWYEIFFNSIGAGFTGSYCRPKLSKVRICKDPSNIDTTKQSILICPKATAAMRSMAFEPVYKAINDIIGKTDVNLYCHGVNLTELDKAFISVANDPRIKIINASGVDQFLLDVFDSDMVISVDSAAIHFREGVERPAIGIYSSFTTSSRTKHYRFAHSFDIESKCRFQPCFLHERERGEVCKEAEPGSKVAPCLSEGYNPGLFNQLVENMNDYLIQNL